VGQRTRIPEGACTLEANAGNLTRPLYASLTEAVFQSDAAHGSLTDE